MRTCDRLLCAGLLAAACLAGGCRACDYRRQADRMVAKLIWWKQREALGRREPFTVERPADTLRRRLLLGQSLPVSGKASLGTDQLPRIAHWPEKSPLPGGRPDGPGLPWKGPGILRLTLVEALQVAARNHRDYQARKEDIFLAALNLDLESDVFRNTFAGAVESFYSSDLSGGHPVGGLENTAEAALARQLKTGASLTSRIALDLVKLLTLDRSSAFGILADATISIPLLRGSGRHIVTEPLTQAERELLYAIYTFERFKRVLAVQTASEYLAALQQLDQVANTEDNYRRLIGAGRRARRLADAGRLPEIQVDQARQDELRARDRWVAAQQAYLRRLDTLKVTLGLPADAEIELDKGELQRMAEAKRKVLGAQPATQPATRPAVALPTTRPAATQPATAPAAEQDAPIHLVPPSRTEGGPLEMAPSEATKLAMANRLDLRVAHGRVYDAQRRVVVAADALKAGLTLIGSAEVGGRRGIGTAGLGTAHLRPERGTYGGGLLLDLPWERTAERNAYRASYLALEAAARDAQDAEEAVKLAVRNELRTLLQTRESLRIQAQAVQLARRRVQSTALFLQAGKAQIRDVLEAQEALVSGQNALTAALVNYRIAELELQRDMGVLDVDGKGLWREYDPTKQGRK